MVIISTIFLTIAVAILCMIQLWHKRWLTQAKIEQQILFLHAAIDSLTDPFFVINIHDRSIEVANSATGSLSQNHPFKCCTLQSQDHKPCDNAANMCPVKLVLARKKSIVVERSFIDHNGEQVYIEMHSSPIFDLKCHVVQVVAYIVDISESRRSAAVEERNHLAQELHDVVSQTLFTASIMAEAVPRVWDQDPQKGKRGLQKVQVLTHGALAEMRMVLQDLRPQTIIELTFGELIQQLTRTIRSRNAIDIDLELIRDTTFPAEIQLGLYRIVQECLNNIIQHAGANHIYICLVCDPSQAKIRVRDDGCGFDTSSIFPGHMGLNIMRERTEKLGAELTITSEFGHGTQISLLWPAPGIDAQ